MDLELTTNTNPNTRC